MHPDRRRAGRAIRKQRRHTRQMNTRLRELMEGNPTP